MFKKFKEFAFKGNVIDMAVGVVIGGAFGKIVTSLVSDIITPFFGYITANVSVADLKYVLTPATEETAEVAIKYGMFIQNIIDFFVVMNMMNSDYKKKSAETFMFQRFRAYARLDSNQWPTGYEPVALPLS